MMKCKIPSCPREQRTARFCANHYLQLYNYGEIRKENIGLLVPRHIIYRRNEGICTYEGCERPQRTKQMCAMHYQSERKKNNFSGKTGDKPLERANERQNANEVRNGK